MASTDISGIPILIISLIDVKTLMEMLDRPETSSQDELYQKIIKFLNDPDCINWERKRDDEN